MLLKHCSVNPSVYSEKQISAQPQLAEPSLMMHRPMSINVSAFAIGIVFIANYKDCGET